MRTRKPVSNGALILLAGVLVSMYAQARTADDEQLQKAADAYNTKVDRESQEVVCTREAHVGSRIKRPVCRTKKYLKWEQYEAQRFVKKPRPSVTTDDPLGYGH